jgi:hypothetical protein
MLGYLVEVARAVRSGSRELPPWDRRWSKIKDGFKFGIALLVWYSPAVLLAIPGEVVVAINEASGHLPAAVGAAAGILNTASSVWGLAILVLEAAIISQYIDRGLGAALGCCSLFPMRPLSRGTSSGSTLA